MKRSIQMKIHTVGLNEIIENIYLVVLFIAVNPKDDRKLEPNMSSSTHHATNKIKSDAVSIEAITVFINEIVCLWLSFFDFENYNLGITMYVRQRFKQNKFFAEAER